MPIRQWVNRGVKKILTAQGYQIRKIQPKPQTPAPGQMDGTAPPIGPERSTMGAALHSLARRLPTIVSIIDIGASNGMWTEGALDYFPRCQYLLIEAQPVHAPALTQFCREHPNTSCVLAAAGASVGEIYFDASEPLGGVAGYTPFSANNIQVPVTTVDVQTRAHELPGPYLLKLDTHGFEVPIFEGASTTLANTAAIVVECYIRKFQPETLLFHEMCAWLEARGFRCIDIVDILRQPADDSLWQMDMVFVRADRPEFKNLSYQ